MSLYGRLPLWAAFIIQRQFLYSQTMYPLANIHAAKVIPAIRFSYKCKKSDLAVQKTIVICIYFLHLHLQ